MIYATFYNKVYLFFGKLYQIIKLAKFSKVAQQLQKCIIYVCIYLFVN